MPKFTASEEIEDVEYDFSPRDKPGAGPKGIVPDPSPEQILTFQDGLSELMVEQGIDPTDLEDGTRKLLDELRKRPTVEENLKVRQRVIDLHAAVCSHQPTAEEIGAQSYRVQEAFFGYIQRSFLNPEA